MIFDLQRELPEADDRSDVLVVGAGAAGIVLALELSRRGRRVTLLEAGGREIEQELPDTYRSEIAGQRHTGVHNGRFRAFGGTTRRWGGQILELDAEDFEPREWVPGSGWPFPKNDLKPFYTRALELEGVAGSLGADALVWRAIGMEEPCLGMLEPYFTRWCPEPDFARVHGRELEQSERVQVWLHAAAVELVMDGERATGIRCRTVDNRCKAVFAGHQIVFCLGTIESARFFLQPREGGLPWNRSGLLGRHFQDHLDLDAAEVRPHDRRAFERIFENVFFGRRKYQPKLHLAPEEQRRLGVLNVASTMHWVPKHGAGEAFDAGKRAARKLLGGRFRELTGPELVAVTSRLPEMVRSAWRLALRHRVANPSKASIRLRVQCEQEPLGESRITLSGERDELGLLRTRLDWRISDRELASMRAYVAVARKELAGVAAIEPDRDLMDGGAEAWERVRARIDDGTHHMGGMRMDADPMRGVVDPELRLHGTCNVWVCSGAVFPSSGFSNPTHTLLALAVRLAARLA